MTDIVFTPGNGPDCIAIIFDKQTANEWVALLQRYLDRPEQQWPIYTSQCGVATPRIEPKPEPAKPAP